MRVVLGTHLPSVCGKGRLHFGRVVNDPLADSVKLPHAGVAQMVETSNVGSSPVARARQDAACQIHSLNSDMYLRTGTLERQRRGGNQEM